MFNTTKIELAKTIALAIREEIFTPLNNKVVELEQKLNALSQHLNVNIVKPFVSNPYKVVEGSQFPGVLGATIQSAPAKSTIKK